MRHLIATMQRAAACALAAGLIALTTAVASRASVWQIPFDPTGGSESQTTISGTLSSPVTLDFTLNLNAAYTSDPTSSVSGDVQFGVFNSSAPIFLAQTGGTAFSNDVGNLQNGTNTQDWLNTIVFPVLVNPTDLPLLVVSLVDSFGGLTTEGGATINPTLTVDLPDSLVASNGMVVGSTVTPIPAAFPLFATGLGVMGLLGRRRNRREQA